MMPAERRFNHCIQHSAAFGFEQAQGHHLAAACSTTRAAGDGLARRIGLFADLVHNGIFQVADDGQEFGESRLPSRHTDASGQRRSSNDRENSPLIVCKSESGAFSGMSFAAFG